MDFDINTMSDHMKQSTKNLDDEQFISTTSKFIHTKPSHFPYSTQNPYDDGLLLDSFQLKKKASSIALIKVQTVIIIKR